MVFATTLILAVGLMGCAPAVSYASGTHPWEWAATFDLPAGHYTWSFTKTATGYADSTVQILVLKTSGTSQASLEAVESSAVTAWGSTTNKSSYEDLEVGTSYNLFLDQDTWTTHFVLHVDVAGGHAVFLQHLPYEFENGFHFLKTEGGEDVEHVFEEKAAGHSHGHGETVDPTPCPWSKDWEWAGIFAVSPGVLDWNAEKQPNGAYPDATMIIAVFTTSQANFSALDTAVHTAWDASNAADQLQAGGTIPLNRAITLNFNQDTWASHFKISVPANSGGHIAVFAQHFPIEFERNYHYLKNADGSDIEPEFQQSGNDCVATPAPKKTTTDDLWGEVILASCLTVLPTLLSVGFIALLLVKTRTDLEKMAGDNNGWLAMVHNFASGVIFSAGVFLLAPEGLYLTAVGKTEAGGNGAWGTAIMSGWFFCVIIKHVGQLLGIKTGGLQSQDPGEKPTGIDWTVCTPILFGDGFHNIADGLVLGTAFKTCTSSFGWKLTGITIAHEIPQEISDFAVLITKGRMDAKWATLGNFLSGCTTILGAIITYSIDVSPGVEGVILSAGAGVYLYVAMTELGPMVTDLPENGVPLDSIKRLLAFAIGAILLGLILLDHEHCGGKHLLSYDPSAKAEEGSAGGGGGGGGGHHH